METEGGGRLTSIRVLVLSLFLASLAAVALVPALAADWAHSDRVTRGVHSMGRDFGNLRREEVPAAVKITFEDYARRPHRVESGNAEVSLTAADLGATIDLEATARRIVDATLADSFSDRIGRLMGRYSELTVMPVMAIDAARADAALSKLAVAIDRPAEEPDLRVTAEGATLRPGQNGRRLDLVETGRRLSELITAGVPGDVEAVVRESPPNASGAQWRTAADLAQRIVARPVYLRYGQRSWTIAESDLARLLAVEQPKDPASPGLIRWDEPGLRALVERIAREVDAPAIEARVQRQGGRFLVVEGSAGIKVDVAATSAALQQAASGDARDLTLSVLPVPPPVVASDWNEAAALANLAAGSPLQLVFRDQTRSISAGELAAMITFTRTQASNVRYTVALDDRQLGAFLGHLAQQIDRPKRDARFKFREGKVGLLADSQEGLTTDTAATAAAIAGQVFGDQRTVQISVITSKPRVLAADIDKISFPDLIVEATTSYAGSIPERAHNVQLATARLNGTLVPPGGVFSFNESVGPTTLAAGYQIGYGITLQGGQAVTVPAEAGGICQVATTLFHSVFWAGLPIVERQSHLYWISRYGTPPRGMLGLDATVDDPWVDFKFRNTTPGWLLVESSTDGQNVRFALRGTKTGWAVKIDPPEITAVLKASQVTVRQEDATKPKGWELLVEHAEDGFTAHIRRTVTKGGQIVDSTDVVSHYRPAQNVLLVGTKPIAPAPATGATPQPAAAPTVAPRS